VFSEPVINERSSRVSDCIITCRAGASVPVKGGLAGAANPVCRACSIAGEVKVLAPT
jgi:hypothetical protein